MKFLFSQPEPIKNGISFSIGLKTEVGVIYIMGVRVIRGIILFPAYKAGVNFIPVVYGNSEFTLWLYQQLIDMDWPNLYNFTLKPVVMATTPVTLPPTLYTHIFEKTNKEIES